MQPEEFLKDIHSEKIGSLYLFIGDSRFLMEDAWKKLLSSALSKGHKNFNGERAHAGEKSAGHVIERLSTTPMFGGRRLFMVEGIEAWGKDDRAAMESFLPRLPPSACLVLTASGRKNIESIAKSVESRGKIVQFRAPGAKEAPRWLMEKARERGKNLSHRAASLLVETAGDDFQTLSSELEKICAFVGERASIEAEDVQEAASSQRGFSMFELLDQVKAQQAARAIRSLRSLILSGEAPLKILSSLAWQIRTIWQVKEGLKQGMAEAELAKKLGQHPFVVKKARGQADRFTEADLYGILESIRQADVAIKSTGASPEVLLEELLTGLCLDKKKPSGGRRGPR